MTFRRRFRLDPRPRAQTGPPPFGWRREEGGRLEVDLAEARAIRVILGQAEEGRTIAETIQALEMADCTPRATRWWPRTIRKVRNRYRWSSRFWGAYAVRPFRG